jgi:DNA N-6-adenine-methyltransferase (Dam)
MTVDLLGEVRKRRSMGSHQSGSMVSDVWLTPPGILEALGDFDLDPCAAPHPRPWPTAREHICLPQDGLAAEWKGRVWCNPPYSAEAVKWLRRMARHSHGTALVFARTETGWFFETVWKEASAVLFLEGRLHFHRACGQRAPANAGAPSCLVAYGERDARILGMSGLRGAFVKL